ncbi:MAG: sigma-70 family RNA polymerase sigma factor [Acidimicrobiales bacterium]
MPFVGFAVPTGELGRHFRDRTWVLKVSRRAKDLYVQLPAAIERLNVELGRQPTPAELAASLDRTLDEVLDALDAEGAYRPLSTDADDGVRSVADLSATTESTADDRLLVSSMLAQLPEREREIVALRYFEDLSQSEIAERVGVSQVHVSRLLRRALLLMRPDEVEPADVP